MTTGERAPNHRKTTPNSKSIMLRLFLFSSGLLSICTVPIHCSLCIIKTIQKRSLNGCIPPLYADPHENQRMSAAIQRISCIKQHISETYGMAEK